MSHSRVNPSADKPTLRYPAGMAHVGTHLIRDGRPARLATDHLDLAQSLNNMGSTLGSLGQADKAFTCHVRALKMYENVLKGEDHSDLATSLNNMGFVLNSLGESSKALPHYEKALAMENIKQASMQNVASTKQAESSAEGLHNLGQKLKQLMEQYKV